MHANYHQHVAYATYFWLKTQTFDIIHFHALGGSGYYTLQAKRQGLFPASTQLIVGVHAIAASEMYNIERGVSRRAPVMDKDLLIQDYMQQRSAELAV
jgi:hypothetical protein